jgi:sugar phosphate isomerase/epimerase
MLKAVSTYVHVNERLHPGLLDGLARGGAQGVEIFATRSHFNYTDGQQIRELASYFRGTPTLEFHSLHSPLAADDNWRQHGKPLNISARDRKDRIEAADEIKRAIEVAEHAPFRFLIQHIGNPGESFDMHNFEGALSSIEHLRAFAKPLGVQLLLENIPNDISAPEKLVEIIKALHYDDIGMCFDFGHAHLEQGVAPAFEIMKPYIRSTHVHDNKKDRDSHVLPGEGTIDWKQAMDLLRTAPAVPACLLELDGDPDGSPEFSRKVPEVVKGVFEKLGA